MNPINTFPKISKSNSRKYPRLKGINIPNQWSLAIIDLNVLYSHNHSRAKDIASEACKIMYKQLPSKIRINIQKLNITTIRNNETYLHNEARFGLRHLRKSKLATNTNKHYSITPLGKKVIKETTGYCNQYNKIVQLLKHHINNIDKIKIQKKHTNSINIRKYIITKNNSNINRNNRNYFVKHLHQSKKINDPNPVNKLKKEIKDGNSGEDLLKKYLELFYEDNNHLISYKSPHLNHKNPNDAFGCDACVYNIRSGTEIYIDAKKISNSAFQFYMSSNEISRLLDGIKGTNKQYCIYFFNTKYPYLHIYRTGDISNGLNNSKGIPCINFNQNNNIFQIDRYIVRPTKG